MRSTTPRAHAAGPDQPVGRRYEEKKGGDAGRNVFPADVETIPAFSVVEIMFSPANHGGFEQGYGLQVIPPSSPSAPAWSADMPRAHPRWRASGRASSRCTRC